MALTNRKLAARALAGMLLISAAFPVLGRDSADPKLKSMSVLILDQAHGSVLYSRNADVAAPIASITKLMTALVVLDAKQSLNEQLQITADDRDLDVTTLQIRRGAHPPALCR